MSKRWIPLAIPLLLLAAAAQAGDVFTVVLHNGKTFDSRYLPVDAEWDENVSMLLTDQGNWIALPKGDIADVTSTTEEGGFGIRLDATTILLGWTYNEGDDDFEGGEGGAGAAGGPAGTLAAGSPGGALQQGGQPGAEGGSDDSYSIDQFVSTTDAGAGGGIPVEYTVY